MNLVCLIYYDNYCVMMNVDGKMHALFRPLMNIQLQLKMFLNDNLSPSILSLFLYQIMSYICSFVGQISERGPSS